MEEYISKLDETFEEYKANGVDIVAYGDITTLERFEDPTCLSVERAKHLEKHKMKTLFPLIVDTRKALQEFIAKGFKSIITCINPSKLYDTFAGNRAVQF